MGYDGFLAAVRCEVAARPVKSKGWVNIYQFFCNDLVWPRGLPLQSIRTSASVSELGAEEVVRCPVQQSLADGDPDVDAIYRMVLGKEIKFCDGCVVIRRGTYCPFNSQNTLWWPEAYPLMYLPSFVSFRMTDIWRSLVAQVCLFRAGLGLSFHGPTVFQERNAHNLMRDFTDEVPGYLNNARIVEGLESLELGADPASFGGNLRRCYAKLVGLGVVPERELGLVDEWLGALQECRTGLSAG
jgi:STELLO glycosyltransferases